MFWTSSGGVPRSLGLVGPAGAAEPAGVKVADDKLRGLLGFASINFRLGEQHLAIIDTPLQG
jgi:hypothetical protein